MASEDFMGSSDEGPAGENFGEEERKRKMIFGSLALVGGILAIIVIIYAFGLTSAKTDKEYDNKKATETKQQK